ncbi:MAG: MotA/TolQ/ExbB proton channel family protein [Candidatus Cloacimonetes bacterium]|nr:MotA/TolQ/ExbB proton channel family protein [Candidatus Cloacimonadota bacterium]
MKLSVILGFIFGFGIILITVLTKEDTTLFLNWSSLTITLGGTLSAVIIYFSPGALIDASRAFVSIFTDKQHSANHVVNTIIEVSKRSKKTSYRTILKSSEVQNISFLEKGLTLISDGVDTDQTEDILIQESRARTARDRVAERVYAVAGSFAPMFGMMGTVIGLIAMLNRIEDPASMPAAMGLALVTTLYGLIFSSLMFKPISGKIRDKNNMDTNIRDIIIEGIRSIQNGDNSVITKEKLTVYLKDGLK